MYHKLKRMMAPRIGLYFVVMLVFSIITALLGHREAGAAVSYTHLRAHETSV